jgi:hypothetical protein
VFNAGKDIKAMKRRTLRCIASSLYRFITLSLHRFITSSLYHFIASVAQALPGGEPCHLFG